MKLSFTLIAGTVAALGVSLCAWSRTEPTHERFGVEKGFNILTRIQIRNLQDEKLGRVEDMGVDLVNGRLVEVLIAADSSLGVGDKIVAVPPRLLISDVLNEVYRLNVSTDVFKSAPAIDLSEWRDAGRSERVAATYRHFGLEPYFLEENRPASTTDRRPKVPLGYVERSSRILNLPVGNFKNQSFGNVWTLSFDISAGRILYGVVLAPGNFKTKSIIPAEAFSFNEARDALLLDDTKLEYANEPRYVFTAAAFGQEAYYHEEAYEGPHTSVALEQGTGYRDVDTTVRINREIRAARIDGRHVQVGTINGRVTLRGSVDQSTDKRLIGEIASAATRQESVDNQIAVRETGVAE